jgi:hypothetical protein
MKNAITLFFAVALVSVLAACELFPYVVTINGTVTVTLDGIPWNTDNFPLNEYAVNTGEALSRGTEPPRDRSYIWAYTPLEQGGRDCLGGVYTDSYQHTADLTKGTYKWSMNIPADRLPCLVYFQVSNPEDGSSSKRYITDGIWVNKENATINLGILNFKTLRLSGNLPVTINGEPLDYEKPQDAEMVIYYPNTYYEQSSTINISPNGDWSLDAIVPDSPQPLEFQVWAEKKGGVFMQNLIPGEAITVHDTKHDTVKDVIFPAHPGVDFKAFNLSGTYKLLLNDSQKTLYSVSAYFDTKSSGRSFSYRAKAEKRNPQPDDNGLIHWETMLPVFSLPHNLPCIVSATLKKGNDYIDGKITPSNVVIPITENTDLSNIHLGSFTVE